MTIVIWNKKQYDKFYVGKKWKETGTWVIFFLLNSSLKLKL